MRSSILLPPCVCQENVPLSGYSTFGIGGPARWFMAITQVEQAIQLIKWAYETGTRYIILGKGSNILFDDRGFPGLVLLNRLESLEQQTNQLQVGSGLSFPRLGQITAKQGLAGLEFAVGIPATVGGAIYMNAGAGGQETYHKLIQVRYLTPQGNEEEWKKNDLIAGYRTSPFQHRGGMIIGATFLLEPKEGVAAKQKEGLEYRLRTQPYGLKSIGCIFRNPSQGNAGKLIESSGLKGLRYGGVSISELHANFIVNDTHQGSAQDVLALIRTIKQRVQEQMGVLLQEEIQFIPYDISS